MVFQLLENEPEKFILSTNSLEKLKRLEGKVSDIF